MKKILKTGKDMTPFNKETCYKCKCQFTYEQEDIEFDRDGNYVTCPQCGTFIAAKPFKQR